MADEGEIRKPDPDKGEAPHAVTSVTEGVPHEADSHSAPGPYSDLTTERPPVSTSRPDVPIAQSLVGGAGAPTPPPPEEAPTEDAGGGGAARASKASKSE